MNAVVIYIKFWTYSIQKDNFLQKVVFEIEDRENSLLGKLWITKRFPNFDNF